MLFPYFCAAANREHHLNCSLFLPNPLYNSMIEQSHKQLFTILKSNNYAMILVNPCSCREVNNVVISKMLDYWSFLSNSGAEARIFLFPSIIGIMEDRRVSIKPVIRLNLSIDDHGCFTDIIFKELQEFLCTLVDALESRALKKGQLNTHNTV